MRLRWVVTSIAIVAAVMLSVSLAYAQGLCFNVAVNYAVGAAPFSVFVADLFGNGHQDLAVANVTSNNVSVLKNNGDGTFVSAVNYAVGVGPRSVFAADLDGDGHRDLAVANWGTDPSHSDGSVSVLRNNGDGTFLAGVPYMAGLGPISVFAADLDGDGHLDLAVANYGSNNVSVLRNNGDGTFGAAVNYTVGDAPMSVIAADLNGSGKLDLVVANSASNNISVLKNKGDGTFFAGLPYPAGSGPISVFAADLDGDGYLDLAVANQVSSDVSVLKNNKDGTFGAAVNCAVGSHPRSVFAADLDGDGHLDLTAANEGSHNVSVLKNNGDGTFAAAVNYAAGTGSFSVFAADLNGDNKPNLAVTNWMSNNVSVLINCESPPSCPGNALQFDGADDEVDIPHSPSLSFGAGDQMTVELWFNASEDRSVYHLLGKRLDCGDFNYQLNVGSGELHFFTGPSPTFRVGIPFSTTVGQWVHAAATCDGSVVCLYVNGQLKATGPGTLGNEDTAPLRIGQSGTCEGGQRFAGLIDEVRIWNVARSAAEIAANYNRGIDPSTLGLVGYWTFDEGLGNQTILDKSAHGNDGTLGASSIAGTDDPLRIPSTAPLFECTPPPSCQELGTWSPLSQTTPPSARGYQAMAYDAARQEIVLFGGTSGSNETWVWDGLNWTRKTTVTTPSIRTAHRMAYDEIHSSIVMFGGAPPGSGAYQNDTWTWDGTDWKDVSGSNRPPARGDFGMAYDGARHQVVLFGGITSLAPRNFLADTWVWDGSSWTQKFPAHSPPAREGHGMAYDPVRQQVVLFGGENGPGLNDTWVWDGNDWAQMHPASSPSSRGCGGQVAYDPSEQRVVLFGGLDFSLGGIGIADTWLWDGQNWTKDCIDATPPPDPRYSSTLAYDGNNNRIVLFGGIPASNDTWLWRRQCNCPNQGDITGDAVIDVFDVIAEIGIAFSAAPDIQDPPCPKTRGDVNNDGVVDVFDVIYLTATAFSAGPNPVNPCGP